MANLLSAIAQGFRGAGAAMSQGVYDTQRQEEQLQIGRDEKKRELMLGLMIKAVESGAMAPEVFQQHAPKLGFEGIPQIGPSLDAQANQMKMNEAKDLADRRARFRANPQGITQPNNPDTTGMSPTIEQGGKQTNLDIYMNLAERAAAEGLNDEAERYSKLADLEIKARDKPKNAQFVELPTGKMVGGKPEFQNYAVVGTNEDGTPKLVPQGSPAPKGALVDVNVRGDQKQFENEQKMKDDFVKESKAFIDVRDGYQRMRSALEQKDISAASTLAGATAFMKLLDPGSVVRESELGMAMAASGVLDRLTNYHNILLKGRVLTESQRKDFLAIGKEIFDGMKKNQEMLEGKYREDAKSYKLNPDRVVKKYTPKEAKGKFKTEEDAYEAFMKDQLSEEEYKEALYQIYMQQ